MYRRAFAWIALALAACGGTASTPPDAEPPGACSGLDLGSYPLVGIYHARIEQDGFIAATSFRIDDDGGLRAALGSALDRDVVSVPLMLVDGTATATRRQGSSRTDLTLAQVHADCSITGTWRRCESGSCYDFALLARRVDRLDEPVAEGMTLVGEFAGNPGDPWTSPGLPVNVRVADGVAYVATFGDGLRTVDVTDPAHMVERGHLLPALAADGEIYNDLKLLDGPDAHRFALLASQLRGVVVADVTDPAAPVEVTHFGTAVTGTANVNIHTLFVDGTRAYLANTDLGVEIWELADPAHPVRLATWTAPPLTGVNAFPHDLYVASGRAYVNYWGAGMIILDVSTPTAPVEIGRYLGEEGTISSHSNWVTQIGDRQIAVHGDEDWGARVRLVDVTEGTAGFGTTVGAWGTRPEVSVHNVMAAGTRAYVAYYQDGVRVLDLADPSHPTAIAWYDTWPGYDRAYGTSFFEGAIGIDLDLATQRVYVADSHRGLMVLHLDR